MKLSILDESLTRPLNILNASAGSGKTYNLVKKYIKLLISEEHSTNKFGNIIAMTFTNKAALEMKERIITALDEISAPVFFNHRADNLTNDLCTDLALDSSMVQQRCKLVLENILHHYEEFHIMTIDKFNLRLIKSFGRDLDLPGEFEVVLDESEIIEKIVDDLLNQLGEDQNRELNKLLFKYAQSNIEEGASWNFRNSLVEFGGVLKSERNNTLINQLLEMDLSLDAYHHLHGARKVINTKYKVFCTVVSEALSVTDQSLLPGGGHTINDIGSILKTSTFPVQDRLIKDRLDKNIFGDLPAKKEVPSQLKEALLALNEFWTTTLNEYATLDLFLKNFFNMALLQYMAKALDGIKKDEQIIRISEFNTLISELIRQEKAPFIYERLGTKFKHFLLDEFQDTSHLQWLNLVPLIHESLGHNHDNLIVGDPKQSIYRFKNGVAEQFVELPRIFNPENDIAITQKSDYFDKMGSIDVLLENWRSSSTIVNFNNFFFEQLKERMPEDSKSFYNSIEQSPMSGKNGLVQIVSKPEKINTGDLVPSIIQWVEECLNDGFKPGDICVLGRYNKDCNSWALGLNDAGYKVVSTDSLLINSDLKVQLSIAYLKWRHKPSGENEKKRFAELFFRIRSESYDDYKTFIQEVVSKSGKTYRYFDDNKFLETHFKGYNSFFFKYESLYDLILGFYEIIGFKELQNPYLHHLADVIFDFGLKKGPNLKGFIDDYDRNKGKIAVQIPESDNAINVMTIHKSKGLEFPVVIIPSLNFKMDVKSKFLVKIDNYIIYKTPSAKDVLKPLIDLYASEKNQIITDYINLCYVGMTRPIERLYIQNYFEVKSFGELFHDSLSNCPEAKETDEELIVNLNDGARTIPSDKDTESMLFKPKYIQDRLWFPDISLQDRDELNSNDYLSIERQFGNQFHLLISLIEKKDDIEPIVEQTIQAGEVSLSNKKALILNLLNLFDAADYQSLFENKLEVLNEQSILVEGNTILRPDKIILKKEETIVVDYKTGIPKPKDIKQVQHYKSTLEEMGYPKVSCYLFYTSINELRLIA